MISVSQRQASLSDIVERLNAVRSFKSEAAKGVPVLEIANVNVISDVFTFIGILVNQHW